MRRNSASDRIAHVSVVLVSAVLLVFTFLALGAKPGRAADDSLSKRLVGTWQMVSHKRFTTGEETVKYGGYVKFGADGSANYFYVASDYRTATNDTEREAVLRVMLDWSGRYSIQDGKLVIQNARHTISRQFKIDGDKLTTLPIRVPHAGPVPTGAPPSAADFGETVLARVK